MTDSLPETRVWHRRPGETGAAWTAFECYRDLGPGRTIEAAWSDYRQRRGLTKKRPTHKFFEWKKEHDWEERVRVFDSEVTGLKVEAQVEAIQAATGIMFDRAADVADALVKMAMGEIEADKARIMACRDVLDRVGVTRKRAEATQVKQQNNQFNFDFSGADLHTMIQLADLLDE